MRDRAQRPERKVADRGSTINDDSWNVDVHPGRLVTARIAVDFTRVASVAQSLRTAGGDRVRHILDCRMFDSGGMGFTHPLPPGAYVFSSTITFLDGMVRQTAVPFQVK